MKPLAHDTIIRISAGMLIAMGTGLAAMIGVAIQGTANAKDIEQIKTDQKEYVNNLNEIRLQLALIQGRLGIKAEPGK